jgi:hypothetical protein
MPTTQPYILQPQEKLFVVDALVPKSIRVSAQAKRVSAPSL